MRPVAGEQGSRWWANRREFKGFKFDNGDSCIERSVGVGSRVELGCGARCKKIVSVSGLSGGHKLRSRIVKN